MIVNFAVFLYTYVENLLISCYDCVEFQLCRLIIIEIKGFLMFLRPKPSVFALKLLINVEKPRTFCL